MQQSLDALVARDDGADQDREHDRHAGEVLDAAIAKREARGRLLAAEPECHGEGYCGARIGEIVNGVREQRHAAREDDHDRLQRSRRSQPRERPLDRPHSPIAGRDRRIDNAVRMAVLVRMIVWVVNRMVVGVSHCCSPFAIDNRLRLPSVSALIDHPNASRPVSATRRGLQEPIAAASLLHQTESN